MHTGSQIDLKKKFKYVSTNFGLKQVSRYVFEWTKISRKVLNVIESYKYLILKKTFCS